MSKYIGVKIVDATEMSLMAAEAYLNRPMYGSISNTDQPGYLVCYPDGYESWCPQDQFEEANEPMTGMNFGHAIEAAKKGYRIAREGWNGKNMFVVYQKGYPEGIPCNVQTAEAYNMKPGELFKCRPYLQMRCADGTHQMWLASQSDILERDWMIVQ